MIDLYQYEDFRVLLSDLFKEKQSENEQYSQRQFAREAGISNPGFLNDVIKGKRSLSLESRQKIAKGFGLKGKDIEYFSLLVDFGQAKKPELKEEVYKKILFRRSRSHFARVNPEQAKYYQDYRYPLVRSAVEVCDFKGDYRKLAQFIRPALPELMIKKIVRDLADWNLIYQDAQGHYFVSEKFVEPSAHLGMQVRHLNKTWFKQVEQALDLIPPEERHVSTLLLAVSEELEQKVKLRLESLRKEVFEWTQFEENPTKVVQLSLALFPRTEVK